MFGQIGYLLERIRYEEAWLSVLIQLIEVTQDDKTCDTEGLLIAFKLCFEIKYKINIEKK